VIPDYQPSSSFEDVSVVPSLGSARSAVCGKYRCVMTRAALTLVCLPRRSAMVRPLITVGIGMGTAWAPHVMVGVLAPVRRHAKSARYDR
jgi:hypothetical protein